MDQDEAPAFHAGVEIPQTSDDWRTQIRVKMNKAVTKGVLAFENTVREKPLVYVYVPIGWGDVSQDGCDTGISKLAPRRLSAVHGCLMGHIATVEALKGII